MAGISVSNLTVLFPLQKKAGGKFSGQSAPQNLVEFGSKKYIAAIKDLSFEFEKGQRVGLIGRNGSGKSTLLRVLGGIYKPTNGQIKISGRVSSLFNLNLGVQPDATGLQNIVIRGLVKGWSYREIREKIPEIVEFSELDDFIDYPIRTYSSGMRMRLLFAIATAFSPEILLLDEWIGAGDSAFQQKAAKRMNELVAGSGITVIASHNRSLLENVCDMGIWLNQGVAEAIGPIKEVHSIMDAHYRQTETTIG